MGCEFISFLYFENFIGHTRILFNNNLISIIFFLTDSRGDDSVWLKKKKNTKHKRHPLRVPMLCGELLNGGTAVPCGLLGLWIPGCVRATSPRLLTSPYLPLLAELLASGYLEQLYLECQTNIEDMDLIRNNQNSNTNGSADLDLDLDNDESVFLGEL